MADMASATESLSIEEAIDRVGVGRFQHRLLAVCGVTWAADAAEVLLIAFALPSLIEEFQLGTAGAGLIATSSFVGMLIGAWFWGTLSDYIGRKTGFQLTVLIFAVFGFLSAFAPNEGWLAAFRVLTGFGLGGALPLDFALFAEYLPVRNRGRYLVLLESFWALGTIIATGLAWAIVPSFGWRPLLATSAVAAGLVFWIRRSVPESPRYLVTRGRTEEAEQILRQVAIINRRPPVEERLEASRRERTFTVSALWAPAYRRRTLMLWIVWFAISLAYYGLFIWLPNIFVERGFTFFRTYANAFLLALAQVPGYVSAAYLVERWGRRPTLVSYLAASGLFTYLFAIVSGLGWILWAAVVMSFFSLGAWGALYAYTPEVYPTEMRATGMGWASGMARIGGVLAPILGGLLLSTSLVAALSIYAASFVIGAATVALVAFETKGRPLADTLEPAQRGA
jgi:putative MFS transporter